MILPFEPSLKRVMNLRAPLGALSGLLGSFAVVLMAASVAGAAPLTGGAGPGGVPAMPTIAVPDLLAWRTPVEDATVLSQFVRTAVVKSGTYAVVDKNNMDKVLAEQAFQQTGCTSQECAVKLGRILKVDRIMIGTYGVYEDSRVLTAQIVEVETGRIAASESITIPPHEKIEDTAGRFVHSLVNGGSTGGSSSAEAITPAAGSPAGAVTAAPSSAVSPSGHPWIGTPPDQPESQVVRESDLPRTRSPWLWVGVAAALVAVFGGVAAATH